MKSKSFYAISLCCLVGCAPPSQSQQETRELSALNTAFQEVLSADTVENTESGGVPLDVHDPCLEHTRLKDGQCVPEQAFQQEQEVYEAQVIARIKLAESPQEQAKAMELYVEQQVRQIDKAEHDLDEIIQVLKEQRDDLPASRPED